MRLHHESAPKHPRPPVPVGISVNGGGDNRYHGREPGAAGSYPQDDHSRIEQPAHVRYEVNADRARKAEVERDESTQCLQRLVEELSQSMQDVEDQWQENYSALEESHKEMLKLKGEAQEVIAERERQHKKLSQRCRALKDSVTLHYQAEQIESPLVPT